MYKALIDFIREQYQTNELIPLHAPIFEGKEKQYLLDTIDSTFVSSVGAYVDKFEQEVAKYTNSPCAVVTVNGTAALHIALLLADVQPQDYVITQSLSFVATCNAIAYCQAEPIFIDVEKETLGLSPAALDTWLSEFAYITDEATCCYKMDNRIIRACVPMHTFGHPVNLNDLMEVCARWHLELVEDAAESMGSFYHARHTGTFGKTGILSFNGNKIMTTGGGGMILCDTELGRCAKHLTTTAKIPHPYEYNHDRLGFNYRMPNINAALGCAQLEQMGFFLKQKRLLALRYQEFLHDSPWQFVAEPKGCQSNYWLNAIICEDSLQKYELLAHTNEMGVMTRPAWQPLHHSVMYKNAPRDELLMTEWLNDRLVNLPSSVIVREDYA